MQLSIITTLYKSEAYIEEFLQTLVPTVEKITADYEIIVVDDGSPDQSLSKALSLKNQYPKMTIIELSRNFGHHEAGILGLSQAQGDYIFLIDSDLEESPTLLGEFWQRLQERPDVDVIYGVQAKRKGNWFEQISGNLFYILFNAISEVKIPANLLTVRLMKRGFVNAVLQYPEKNVFLAGLMVLAGFNQQPLTVHKTSKKNSTYSFTKKIQLFITCITAFSSKPLEFMLAFGAFLTTSSCLSTLVYTIVVLFFQGTTSVGLFFLLATVFIAGIIILCTGILGVYLAKIYTEVKQRPRAIIKRIY